MDGTSVVSGKFTVRCYEQDLSGKLRPGELFNWFQEVASNQCRQNGVALEDILPRGYTWVIHRYKAVIDSMPAYGQECEVCTWAQPKRDLISVRDFLVRDAQGRTLVRATSEWALIDLKTQRPARLSALMTNFPYCQNRALDEALKPIKMPEGAAALRASRAAVSAWALDKNNHVNNSVYVFWACDNLYPDAVAGRRLKEMEINYRKQGFHGQETLCRTFAGAEGEYYQEITLAESGDTLALVRSVWEKQG